MNLFNGGSIGTSFDVNAGVEFNVSGGTVGENLRVNRASEANISGGVIGRFFQMLGGEPSGHISGGTFDSAAFGTQAGPSDQISISGGSFGRGFNAFGNVEIVGDEFTLNGSEFLGNQITLMEGDVFSGTLADGSAFVFDANVNRFSSASTDRLQSTNLRRTALPAIDTAPQIINSAMTQGSSLREGQTLTLRDGGELVNFEAVNATFQYGGW